MQVAALSKFWVDCGQGDDTAGGTAASPFATLRRARDAARSASAPCTTIMVVGGGTCRSWLQQGASSPQLQNASLELDARDSHCEWQSVGSAHTVLSGGVPAHAADWKPLTAAQRQLFKPAAAAHVVSLDLAGVVDNIGRLKGLSYSGGDACIETQFFEESGLELVHAPNSFTGASGRKLHMARFPDLIEPPVPSNWLDYHDPDNTNLTITVAASARQKAAWAAQVKGGGQVFTHGLWTFNWADSHRRVVTVTAASDGGVRLGLQQHGDFTDRDCKLTAAAAGQQGGHVYIYNAHYELDQPGEYTIDHNTRTLYFLPPTGSVLDEFELSVATSLLHVHGASNISFNGFDFRAARGAGIVIVNSSDITIADGAVSDTGMATLNITGGARCGAHNMTLVRGGTGGAVLAGGDRQTLEQSSHFIRGSIVRDCNRWVMNYAPLVLMAGVGQLVNNSVLSDAPQMAVFVQGNLHHLINSQVHDVVQQCNDVSAQLLLGSSPFGHGTTGKPLVPFVHSTVAVAVWGVLLWEGFYL